MIVKPPVLQPGDKVMIVAPGRKVSPSDLDGAIASFKLWGVEPILSRNLYSNAHSYLAGSDHERLQDIQTAINDPSVKAIICARGGYGSTRILDLIDFSALQKNPKWVVGFSDVTAVHLKLCSLGFISIHGTMPILFSKTDSAISVNSLRELLFTGNFHINGKACDSNKQGHGKGKLIGGNLSLIADALGTSAEPDTTDAILVIEEIDEYLYKLDRMLMQLHRANKLKSLQGLLVGHMTDIKDTSLKFGETVQDIILRIVGNYNFPIAFNFPSGHENPNLSWLHGESASLIVDANGFSLQNNQVYYNKY